MICPECNSGTMEMIIEGIIHCANCNHLLKEKEILVAQKRAHLRPRRRVGDNCDEFQIETPIFGEGTFNENLIDSIPDQRNFNESSVTNFSEGNNISSSESVELINSEGKINRKENVILPVEKYFLVETSNTSMPNKKENKNNSFPPRFYNFKSYDNSKPIWIYIYKFIEDNSEYLLLLKDKNDSDEEFLIHLTKLLINKLSNETGLLNNLHRNTIKALPKVIIAIFLLYFQKIELISGENLEKKSGMVGQYKKLRVLADHLGLELPFIMGDVVERILEKKKEDIFKGEFFPSQENICRYDKRLISSRKMVKTISRWIRKTSNYQNLTELKQIVYEKKEQKSIIENERLVLLDNDKFKHSKEMRKICNDIIQRNPNVNSYADIRKTVGADVIQYFRTDYRRYIKFSEFFKIQYLYGRPIPHKKFVKSFTTDKWIFLWQDSEGEPITIEQAIDLAAKYLIKEVLKHNTNNYDLDFINNVLDRNDFISALSERGIRYNEVLVTAGLELHSEPGKWGALDWSLDRFPRTYEDALNNAAKHLKKLMLDYNYEKDKIPSQEYILKYHGDFHGALRRYDIDFYDVLKKTGSPVDKFRKKWWLFDNDEQGTRLAPKEQEETIFTLFKEKIFPIYMVQGLIEGNLGPSYDEAVDVLKDTEFHGFVSAINARGVSHGSLLLSVGISPRITPNQQAGIAFHWIAEWIFMKHTRIDNNCISFYESKSDEESLIRPDNTILVNKEFRKLSKYSKLIPSNIKLIHVDYYLTYSSKRSQYKHGRGYQNKDSILFLVPLNIKDSRKTPLKNVKILSVYDFCDFFDFSDELRRKFIHFARLALDCKRGPISCLESLSKLEQKADQYKNELKTNKKINFSI